MPSSLNRLHMAAGGRCRLLRIITIQTRVQVRRIPVPPIVLSVRLLVRAVVLFRLVQELG